MASLRNFIIVLILILILGGLVVGLTWMNLRYTEQNPGGNDFLARWTGARYWLVEGINPYDSRVSLAAQRLIYGRPAEIEAQEDIAHFVYPLHSMVFFGVFGLMEYIPARAIWMTLLEICLTALAIVGLRLVNWRLTPLQLGFILLFSVSWYPSVRTVILGQFAGVNALLIIGSLWLIRQRQDFAAGILLALSTTKPQMTFLFVPFVLLWGITVRRRDLVLGTLLTFFLLMAISVFLVPGWPLEWFWQLLEYRSYTELGSVISILTGYAPGIQQPLNLLLHLLALAYLLVEWYLARGKDETWFLWTALLTLVMTNFIAWRTATTHFPVLLPVLFLLFRVWEERWGRVGSLAMYLALAVLGVGLWALFLQTVQGNIENPVMYLPVPILCLLGLWWVRWWVISPPKLLIDRISQWDSR